MRFLEHLRAVRVLRASGTPPALARPVVEAALQAAEAMGDPAHAERLARARQALPTDPWDAHAHLEAVARAEEGPLARALRVGPFAALAVVGLVALGWAAWTVATRPAWDEGLDASYHTKRNLRGAAFARRDATLDHGWGHGRPLPELPVDHFSVVWVGCLASDRPRQVHAGADDGLRVDLGGERIFERWGANGFAVVPGGAIPAGVHTLRVEFDEIGGNAGLAVRWSEPGGPVEPIPASALIPPGGNRRHPCPP